MNLKITNNEKMVLNAIIKNAYKSLKKLNLEQHDIVHTKITLPCLESLIKKLKINNK
ncbi:hypothetical protein UFOVP187_22 [uncultured Caudovirales phage]|uniref:Uncharacterized protein n=1 Tax=uncultured Caudovirales phage TaxID=2100421 RepID=A0A6J7WI93_9CAUD|nr:hypothetical protein UFOVP187_22 [uncultured Caudovirales phage]